MIPQGEPDAVSVLCEKTHCGRLALLLPLAETPLSWKSLLFLSRVRVCTLQWDGTEYKASQEQHGWFNISSHLSLIPPSAASYPSHGAQSLERAGSRRCRAGGRALFRVCCLTMWSRRRKCIRSKAQMHEKHRMGSGLFFWRTWQLLHALTATMLAAWSFSIVPNLFVGGKKVQQHR